MFLLSSLFGVVSGVSGLALSVAVDVPASSMIILAASAIIAVCIILGRRFNPMAKHFEQKGFSLVSTGLLSSS